MQVYLMESSAQHIYALEYTPNACVRLDSDGYQMKP